MDKHVIIVGAGIAGLTAGIYARRSGVDVTLIDQHSIPGGMCTSWRRKGYLFEGAIHWLTGSSPETELYQVWKETGALGDDVPVLLRDPFRSVECEGQLIHMYRDIDRTAEHLGAVSPEDKPLLRQLARDVKAVCNMQIPVFDVKGVKAEHPRRMAAGAMVKMMPALSVLGRMSKISSGEYTMRFTHPGIQRLLRVDIQDNYSASALFITLATLHSGDGGYPEGGALAMADRMAKTFTGLGGRLLLDTKVQRVNVKGGKASGVILADGTTAGGTMAGGAMDADAVIVTQETIAALDHLFDTPPRDAWLKDLRETVKPTACTFVSLGVRSELPDGALPGWRLETPITYAGLAIDEIGFNSYRQYAPEGCTALTVILSGDTYDFWKQAMEAGRYAEEKEALAGQIVRALCAKYPQCEGRIEVVDVATPLTYERYTGAYRGSWMGVTEPGDKLKANLYPGSCEGVGGLYFAGHRLMPPGGLPAAALTGRQAAQLVCRQFDAVFR